MKIVILLGPPGCGKGTQSEMLDKNLGLKKLSTGDMLREIAAEGNELGREVKSTIESGALVSDDLIIKVIEERMSQPDCAKGVILDGFPRTLAQAEYLEKMLESKYQESKVYTIDIIVKDEDILARILGRFTCSDCLAGYHDKFKPTKIDGVCDSCGGNNFQRRKDDNEEVVKTRLANYYKDTAPISQFYKEKQVLEIVDGRKDMKEVYEDIEAIILQENSNNKKAL